ncbi:DEAD/DEAH box helicase family protein [Lentisphaerota bacterium WC36G]|nr:DEAD/DEAH box helicase family protein [Lentisphaerae bacterium WC36]
MNKNLTINFSYGTLEIFGPRDHIAIINEYVTFDNRANCYRARANDYGKIALKLYHKKISFIDNAKNFEPLKHLQFTTPLTPRDHQITALQKWKQNFYNGVVVLPTGSGKSFLAMMAVNLVKRPTLILVPTIDLLHQWATQLEDFFNVPIGMIGGGENNVQTITISTYDSAVIHMEFIGNKFGLIIFDECHHLPGKVNRNAALMCLAPFKLGLTATPERNDDGEAILYQLVGKKVYELHIDEVAGEILAPYETRQIFTQLSETEAIEYAKNREIYTSFLKQHRINFKNNNDWNKFIGLCARSKNGREVFKAYHTQKKIAGGSQQKLFKLWDIIKYHQGERIIVFTADNETAYSIAEQLFLPIITYRTKASERKDILKKFRSGEYQILITSKVLNEGVDVPEASVGVVISGTGSTREHVQRLGRILRAKEDKTAILYEIISQNTAEFYISKRRREHRAYRDNFNI